jgi:hypothetical protein
MFPVSVLRAALQRQDAVGPIVGDRCRPFVVPRKWLGQARGHGGEIFPSQASLAARAHCSERTVRRAIAMGVMLGLVVVLPRRRWLKGRYVRTSNRYVIGVPDRAVVPGQRPPWPRRASPGQIGLVQIQVSKKEALDELLLAAAAAPDLLTARRAAFAAGLGVAR